MFYRDRRSRDHRGTQRSGSPADCDQQDGRGNVHFWRGIWRGSARDFHLKLNFTSIIGGILAERSGVARILFAADESPPPPHGCRLLKTHHRRRNGIIRWFLDDVTLGQPRVARQTGQHFCGRFIQFPGGPQPIYLMMFSWRAGGSNRGCWMPTARGRRRNRMGRPMALARWPICFAGATGRGLLGAPRPLGMLTIDNLARTRSRFAA
jgi:hypothetical protein